MPYTCKHCGKPVEQAIEGELVCERCYDTDEMTPEEAEIQWYMTHCSECGRGLPIHHSGSVCQLCEDELMEDYFFEEDDELEEFTLPCPMCGNPVPAIEGSVSAVLCHRCYTELVCC